MIYSVNKNSATFMRHTSRGYFNLYIDAFQNNVSLTNDSLGNLTEGNSSTTIFGADYDDS